MTYDINHADVISSREIGEFLQYYKNLKIDSDDMDLNEEDRAQYLEEYQDIDESLVLQLQDMYDGTYPDDDFISERHWKSYAREFADECLLDGVSDVVCGYFDYDAFAHDLRSDYTEWVYDGVSYYSRD